MSSVVGVAALVPGCSKDSPTEPGNGGGSDEVETVSTPAGVTGATFLDRNQEAEYDAGLAASSLDHPLEYRFDFNAEGGGEIKGWGAKTVTHSWSGAGTFVIKAQARCKMHHSVMSGWSEGRSVEVGLGPRTEIFKVTNTYFIGDQQFVDTLDVTDEIPDTVPYGSWLTLFHRGAEARPCSTDCLLMRYQARYQRDSDRNPLGFAEIPWMPPTPENSNNGAPWDTTSMNVGSVEYRIYVRATDYYNRTEQAPPHIDIVGNHDPTLDGFRITGQDGLPLADQDTLELNWWAPADSGFLISKNLQYKRFFFVVEASGHDHPRDPDTSGIESWYYDFPLAGDPASHVVFAHAGGWFDAPAQNVLSDTAWVTLEYPIGDFQGDAIFDNPPRWQNETLDFFIRGRDIAEYTRFQQYLVFSGAQNLMNDYVTGRFGRWTETRRLSFHMRLVR